MTCISCAISLHEECENDPCCCTQNTATGESKISLLTEDPTRDAVVIRERRGKNTKDIVDPKSTGRKRAAVLFPLDRTQPCEWRMQKNCGGGDKPIVGCLKGFQTNRHHGPNKDTLINIEGNVHRICADCHNRWHYLNDGNYSKSSISKIHSPVAATLWEVTENNINWSTGEYKEYSQLRVERFNQRGNNHD